MISLVTKLDGDYSFISGIRQRRLLYYLLVVCVNINRNCSFRKILIELSMAFIYSQAEVTLVLSVEYGELIFLVNHQIPVKSLSKIPASTPVREKHLVYLKTLLTTAAEKFLCGKELLGVNRRSALEDQVRNTWGRKIQN